MIFWLYIFMLVPISGQGKDSNEELVHLFKQWLQVMAEEASITPSVEPSEGGRRVVEQITNIPSPRM